MRLRLPKFLVNWLAKQMTGVVMSRSPDQEIGPKVSPYMLRWILWRKEWLGGVYLHIFLEDDDDRALHDHPFPSLSFVLDGTMREVYAEKGYPPQDSRQHSVRMIRKGDIVPRRASFSHRIELLSDTAVTLFVIGPHIREWGFWCPKIGWRHWKEYASPSEYGEIGRGCD